MYPNTHDRLSFMVTVSLNRVICLNVSVQLGFQNN